jgi:hypothetical protein
MLRKCVLCLLYALYLEVIRLLASIILPNAVFQDFDIPNSELP